VAIEKGKMKFINRAIILLLIVFIFIAIKYYQCVYLHFSPIPSKLLQWNYGNTMVFLSGSGLCGDCQVGRFLQKNRSKPDVLYFVPAAFSDPDIENLRNVFMLNGSIRKSDNSVLAFIKRVKGCNDIKNKNINLVIEINKKNRIKSVQWF
jgi:hypothetical protein